MGKGHFLGKENKCYEKQCLLIIYMPEFYVEEQLIMKIVNLLQFYFRDEELKIEDFVRLNLT